MAFTYRSSETEENIIAQFMKSESIKDKSKCLTHFVTKFPELNQRNKLLEEENRGLLEENNYLKKLLVSKQYLTDIENLIKYVDKNYLTTLQDLNKLKDEITSHRTKLKP